MGGRRAVLLLLLALLPGALLLAWQAWTSWPFFADDSFISLRYSQRLLDGHGLTWTDGERVEGYSNLLWVLATAGLGALGVDLVTAARALGAVCTLLAQLCLVLVLPPRDLRTAARAAVAPLLLAAAAPAAPWTLAGLEGPMLMLWLAWGGLLLHRGAEADDWSVRSLLAAGVPFALACLTRPDGALWTAVAATVVGAFAFRAGVGSALRSGVRAAIARGLALASWPAAATVGQLCFRLYYYGDRVPNTAHVKLDMTAAAWAEGVSYLGRSAVVLAAVLAAGALGAFAAWRRPQSRVVVAVCVAQLFAWSLYLVAVGGDVFPGYRQWHGALAPIALLAALGLGALRGRSLLNTAIAMLAAAAVSVWQTQSDASVREAQREHWEWDGQRIGELLRAAFAPQRPLLAVGAAGALPYYSELPSLDMLGLCDRTIATTPPSPLLAKVLASYGVGYVQGHMRGNGGYVMDRAPDLVLMGPPPCRPLGLFVSALEFERDPRWLDGYRCVLVKVPGPTPVQTPLWVRVEGRVGVRRAPDRIEVPAMLLGAYRQPRAFRLGYDPDPPGTPGAEDLAAMLRWFGGEAFAFGATGADGQLELELTDAQPAVLQLLVPAGRWRFAAEPAASAAQFELQLRGDGVTARDGVFEIAGEAPRAVELVAMPRAGAPLPLRLRAVRLSREQ